LADSYALMSGYSLGPANESIPKARAAALEALQLDEKLAEAHVSLALIAQDYDWDWQTAMKEYERAIQLDPNYATAHHEYAEGLALQGRFEEATSEMKRGRELDPLSLIMATDNGAILYYSRQYDRAIEQLNSVLEMEPAFPHAHIVVYAYVQKGQFDEALAVTENWRRTADSPWIWASIAYVYGRAGKPAQARRAIERLEQLNRRNPFDPAPFVMAYTGIVDRDQAFAWLNKAVAARSPSLVALKVDPLYDPLRMDPRFQPLLHTIGLAQ
jgi:tetratricopeptide (TPR) repeat protein